MLAPGNAGRVGGAIPISEIIHHSVRRTSSEVFTAQREPSSKRARDGTFFFLVFSFLFFPPSFLSFLYLSRQPSIDLDRRSRLRFSISFQDARFRSLVPPSKKSTSECASGLPDSALRSERFRIIDRMDAPPRPLFFPIRVPSSASSPKRATSL